MYDSNISVPKNTFGKCCSTYTLSLVTYRTWLKEKKNIWWNDNTSIQSFTLSANLRFIRVDEREISNLLFLPKISPFRCYIWRSEGRDYGDYGVLGCNAVLFGDSSIFARNIRFCLQGRWVSQARNQQKQTSFFWFSVWFTLRHWNWRWFVPSKRQFSFTGPYTVISHSYRFENFLSYVFI
jgi:hypothetical protein